MKKILLFILSLIPILINGQTTSTTITTTGAGSWTAPCGVTNATIICVGAGGGGGGGNGSNKDGGGGGGGGGCALYNTIAVTGGTSYNYTVGAGGNGGAQGANGTAGGFTQMIIGATTIKGFGGGLGNRAASGTAGAGGTASGGTSNFSGGNGANGVSGTGSGGGGEGASSTGIGNNAVTQTGGTGNAAGGDGGNGKTTNNGGGNAGTAPGGAGGGGNGTGTGAAGGNGQIVIMYTTPVTANAGPDQTINCSGTTATLAGNTATGFTGAWTTVSGTGVATTPTSATSGVTGLTVGASTTLQWVLTYSTGCSLAADQVIITSSSSCPPANDEPTGATAITVGSSCSYTTFTNASATSSTCGTIPAPGCSSYSGGDVWFSFTVPAGGAVNIDSQTGVITDGGMAVYSGAPCGVMTLIACDDDNSANGLMPYLSLTGQTVGATLYIRFFEYGNDNNGTFGLCVTTPPPPPANDNCAGAYTVAVNSSSTCTSQTGGTVAGATASGIAMGACFGTADDDVWYSFVATSTTHSINITNVAGSVTDMYHSVYSGSCGSLSAALVCSDPDVSTVSGLTIGNTYYVRVYTYTGTSGQTTTFSVCITTPPPPPANDEPTGATAITVGSSCSYTVFTNANATSSTCGTIPAPGCSSYSGGDVWFSFTVPAGGAINIDSQTGVMTDGGMAVYSGAPCGVMTLVACDDDASANGLMPYLSLTGQTVGATLYIRFFEYGNDNNGTFGLCVTTPPTPPANDNPCTATSAPVNATYACTVQTGGTLVGATTSTVGLGACFGTPDDDVWYSFVANNSTQNISLNNLAGSTSDLYFSVHPGTCGAIGAALLCSDPESGTITGLTVGTTYYIRIYSYTSTTGQTSTFSLCITPPCTTPSNDNCSGAISVPVNSGLTCGSQVYGTVCGATASGIALGACGGTADDDVWFSFVATSTAQTVSFNNISGSTTDLYHSVYSGSCGSLGAALTCSDPNTSTTFGLTIGNTYYVRVYTWTSTTGQTSTFSVCITTPAPTGACGNAMNNDFCSNPATLTQSAGTFSSSTSSLYTADQPGNVASVFCGSIENNSWYSFIATATTANFPITSVSNCISTSGIQAHVYAVSQSTLGCCTSFTSMSNCFNPGTTSTGTVAATGLTIGQTYILMVDGNGGNVCDYTIANWTAVGILPIELLTFVGRNEDEKNKIEWVTATEKNSDYFRLERSKDGVNFETLFDVAASGNSTAPKNYKAFDMNPYEEMTYYRLNLFSLNGHSEYSNIIAINNTNLTSYISEVRPNPTNGDVEFDVNTRGKEKITLEIYNNTGVIINSEEKHLEGGYKSLNLDLNKQGSGIYLLKVTFESTGKVLIKKIIKN